MQNQVTHEAALAALAGLAQETRLAIFRLLVEQGPEGLAAGTIADRLETRERDAFVPPQRAYARGPGHTGSSRTVYLLQRQLRNHEQPGRLSH